MFPLLNDRSRAHAARIVEVLRHEYIPVKLGLKLEDEASIHVAPDVAPWLAQDPDGAFLGYYLRHLHGRIHGAGIPGDTASEIVARVERCIVREVERLRRQNAQ